MVTTNILTRILFIKVKKAAGTTTGTAFTIEKDGKQYLITAAHVTSGAPEPLEIQVFNNGKWRNLSLEVTGICTKADIAVFAPPFQITPSLPIEPSSNGMILSQDVHFLGFPYGMHAESGALNNNFPFPLVKRACLSSITRGDEDAKVILLDGHNNVGFSGAPVVFREAGKGSNGPLKILGVVSGYRFAEEPTYHGDAVSPITVRANTGIIICYDISHAIDEVVKNPNGAAVTK